KYDFHGGLFGFVAPNLFLYYANLDACEATGWMLFFHHELLAGKPLAREIKSFGFFNYAVNEALHLSKQEEQAIENLFENMYTEYAQRIDKFSKSVIISNLELLLTYSKRFYGRQFLTRNEVDSTFLEKFYKKLNHYFSSEQLIQQGFPTASFFADQLQLSTNYLSDLLKTITGKTTREHIHFRIIELAKEKLLGTNLSVAQIAHSLGFEYPQYFNRLFKEKTGQTPKAFRHKDN
ncbi:MAG: helix-turn-helix transcriptional regulator, partial [Bacteroidota bacterium]